MLTIDESFKQIDKSLGSPNVQTILRILICWKTLNISDLIEKTGYSENQIYRGLKQLEGIGVIRRVKRGVYSLVPNPFTQSLSDAYEQLLVQIIGQELHRITNSLERDSPTEVTKQIYLLTTKWGPILERHFSTKLSSLISHSIDRYEEEDTNNAVDQSQNRSNST